MNASPLISRRSFLVSGVTAGAVLASGVGVGRARPRGLDPAPAPFSLGIASGEPGPQSVVLWTRLAWDALHGGGMPAAPVPVQWEIAADEGMRRIVRRGVTIAWPESAHSVHVRVAGLEPDHWYWYRFRTRHDESPTGRTRTLPAPGSSPRRLRFAFVSCQDFENGYYPALYNLAREDVDFVIHLGDYIYEGGPTAGLPRQHNGPEIVTLEDYRNRHALYKSDASLQAVHAAFPMIATWDDHETENDYAAAVSEDPAQPPDVFLVRRAAAYRAYWEHMPLTRAQKPEGPDTLLYRRFRWGRLAEFNILDTRQYRSDQPCGDGLTVPCPAQLDPAATMTGPEQERWLLEGLADSEARWNVIAQQVMMMQANFGPAAQVPRLFNMDAWDGYVAARNRILGFLLHGRPSNPVVPTGDIHSSWVANLKADFDDPTSATVATELVGASISSDFPAQFVPAVQASLPANPHIRFFDGLRHGYVRCDVDRYRWRADFRTVSTILEPVAPVSTLASFVVESGRPGAVPA